MGKIIDFKEKLNQEDKTEVHIKFNKHYEELTDYEVRYLIEKYRQTINEFYDIIQLLTTITKANTKNIDLIDQNIQILESWKGTTTNCLKSYGDAIKTLFET